jgi:predicted ATPase/DNA-binding SARP family transcriptional activator
MARLDVSLLGPFQVTRDATPLSGFAYDKVRALLAYLVVEADRPWRRETLASLFWPDQDDRSARHSLSQALFSLRKAIDDRDADSPLLLVTSDTVQLNSDAALSSDLRVFTALLDACDRHPHRDAIRCRACARRIEQAVDLYRGDLLEGFTLPDSVVFDEWLLVRREQARERVLVALGRLTEFFEGRGASEQAARCARRLIALDPWREDAIRQLMRQLAWTGQRAGAVEQFERFQQRLREDLGVEPEQETLDLLARIRQGQETRPEQPEQFARRYLVPEQVTAFIGRERELADLRHVLLDGTCRLVTLTGPGGIGKTRLAIEAARIAGGAFADGIVVVPLAGLASTSLLASAIGSVLDAPVHGSHDEREALLCWLRERELLLVLDNVEHLLDGVDLIGELLDRAPDLQILVTSRERLDLHGEWVIDVEGLSLPGSSPGPELSSAEQLFLQRASQVRVGFVPSAAERAAIARLCRIVEGMPLALEIAAGWLPVLSCAEIVAEIERSLGFLATTRRDVEPRHQSMHAVFDRSWELLGDLEQRAFRRLSVFRGGFRRDAAERVSGASLPLLSALVSKSLLRRTSDGRYEMHELLRQYAGARLAEQPDEASVVRGRHSDFYLALITRLAPELRGVNQHQVLLALEAEIENLRAAWAAAVEDARADAIAEAAYGLWLFTEITGRNRELQALMQRGVDLLAAGSAGDDDVARQHSLALGRMLVLFGSVFVRTGENDHGDALVERGLELVRALGQPEDVALGLNFRATFAHARLDLSQEEALLRESLDYSARAVDRWTVPYSLNDLGRVMLTRGDTGEATRLHRESLDLCRECGDKRGMAFALHNLGVVATQSGEYDQARDLLQEALAIRRDLRHTWGIAVTLIELGVVEREAGTRDLVVEHLREALHLASETHSLPVVLRVLGELAELLASDGDGNAAARLLTDILRHPRTDASVRERAWELLGQLGAACAEAPAAVQPDSTDEIDRHVRDILQHGWLSLSQPILT